MTDGDQGTTAARGSLRASTKRRNKHWIRELAAHLLLLPLAVSYLLPFFWMLSTSLKSDAQVYAFPPAWIPQPVVWDNYPRAVNFIPFMRYVQNTLGLALFAIIGVFLSCPPVAYSMSRIPWAGRHLLLIVTLSTMMIPYQVTMIPLFTIFTRLGWVGSYLPLVVPRFFGAPFYIFLLRQFFMTIPQELTDAARIDGASELRIYAQIVLPLVKPALASIGVFEFLAQWRAFIGPLIYIDKPDRYTVSIGLQMFRLEYGTEWQMLMAASVLLTTPIIIAYFLVQRTFVQGIALTGLKGV